MLMKAIQWLALTVIKITIAMMMFFMLILVIFASFAALASTEQVPVVDEGSYLRLSFPAGLNETALPALDYSFNLNKRGISLYRVIESIETAALDSRISGVIVDLDHWLIGAEQTAEIGAALDKLRSSGKKVYAYGNYLSNFNYRIALYADRVVMPPSASAMVNLTGYSNSFPYYKGLGDKLGITMQVIHVGDYKAYGENYSREKMSEEFKSELIKIYDKISAGFTDSVASRRNLPGKTFADKLFAGKYALLDSKQAMTEKLIDTTQFYDDFVAEAAGAKIDDVKFVDIEQYAAIQQTRQPAGEKIALLVAEGDIVLESISDSPFSESSVIAPARIGKHIRTIADDPAIKAVVLRINSGGGSALASEIIHSELVKLQAKKPLVISMGAAAASGGYYIACTGSKIFAEKNTITGSIGVVGMLPNFHGLTQKAGINYENISKGKYADLYDLTKPVSPEETALLQASMQRTYLEFKSRVSASRKIDDAELEKIAQGRVWTGEQAKEIGLVDEIGGIKEAIAEAAKLAKSENYSVELFPREKTLMESLMKIELEDISAPQSALFQVPEIKELSTALNRYRQLGRGALMLCPYEVSVK